MAQGHIEIVAEAGINHNGSIKTALELVDAAKDAGADIIKFQTFITEKTIRMTDPDFEVIKSCELPHQLFKTIAQHCEDAGIEFMSTPDEQDSLKFLVEEVGVKRIKIGSADLLNWDLVSAAMRTGLPLIVSTGMATMDEIRSALGGPADYDFTLLHCVSLYPCPEDAANVAAMDDLSRFGLPVGYSDHTEGYTACLAAAGRGAVMLEKHFTLDQSQKGPDHKWSANPRDFAAFVRVIRRFETVLGHGRKEPGEAERAGIPRLRKTNGLRGLAA